MSDIRLDHFITAAATDNIDSYLDEYRKGGFQVMSHTVQHNPGLRNGFIRFGPEYLEFVWVEDEAQFEQGADTAMFPRVRELRAGRRPFGIGIDSADLQSLHDDWAGRGYELPAIVEGRPRGASADSPPIWSFQTMPPEIIEGAICFALTYHTARRDAPRKITLAPNSTYAIAGITFATDDRQSRATAWRDLLAPSEAVRGENGICEVTIRPHVLAWMTPLEYQEQYGLSYKASPHPFGEMAVIHMLAADLDRAEAMIGEMGRNAARLPDKRTGVDTLIVPPDVRDGFMFAITEWPVEEWLRERVAATGERLELETGA